jgi:hypothetical protein
MEFISPIFDIYSAYLIVNQGQATATNLSSLIDNRLSHDSITRALSAKEYSSKDLWKVVKPFAQQISSSDGVLMVDDSIEEKAYMDENDLICWHFDHCLKRSVKGVNQITALYHSEGTSLPVCFEMIHKTVWVNDKKKNKSKRISAISKQELFRQLIKQSIDNNLVFAYILADSWFSCAENFNFIQDQNRLFIIPLKANRKVALSLHDKHKGKYQPIESLELEVDKTLQVWVEGVDFPLLLTKQVFQNEDGSEVCNYLVTNDLTADSQRIKAFYEKRWKIELFHKSVKSLTGYAKSPARTVTTQTNHIFLSMLAFIKLESIKIETKKNHFQIKKILTLNALKVAWKKLQSMKENNPMLKVAA